MKRFNEFGIKTTFKNLVGDKIKMERILNREIIVDAFKIEESKFENKNKCLYMQIQLDNAKRVVFTGSQSLIDAISQVKHEDFPFQTTIIKTNGYYEFS